MYDKFGLKELGLNAGGPVSIDNMLAALWI
jgi:hypothetical protein